MTEDKDPPSAVDSPQRRRPVWTWIRRLLIILLATVGILLWLSRRPPVSEQPVRLVRGADGQFAPVDDSSQSDWQLEFHVGGIKANNSLTTTSSHNRPSHGGLACGRMVIMNESDHLLMQRVGSEILQLLQGLQGLEQIDYYPLGHSPEPGELAPDVTVSLALNELHTSGLPNARRLDAEIVLSAGNSLMRYPSHYFDGLDPPAVQFSITSTLDHESISTGIGTPSARYKLAAEDIAKQLAGALTENLNNLRQTMGSLGELAPSLYPPYTDPPELPLPPGATLELVASHHGLMTSNQSLWRWPTQGALSALLTDLEQRWEEAGWQTSSLQTAANSLPHLRMKRGAEVLMVFPERRQGSSSDFSIGGSNDSESADVSNSTVVFVYYANRMTREETTAAIEPLMDRGHSALELLPFESFLQGAVRERWLSQLEADRPTSSEPWLMIAQLHNAADRPEQAKTALQRAQILTRALTDPGELRNQADKLAEKMELPKTDELVPSQEFLDSLGLISLSASEFPEREVAADENTLFYTTQDDTLVTLAVRIVPQEASGNRRDYDMVHIECRNGSRAWGRGGLTQSSHIPGVGRVMFQAKQIDDEPRFVLSTSVTKDWH